MSAMAIQGFISWAHADHKLLDDVWPHIGALELTYDIEFWRDKKLKGGDDWNKEIETALTRAQCHLVMVSAHCLNSDYIVKNELPLIEQQRRAGKFVVPVLLKPCIYRWAIHVLQAVPMDESRQLRAIEDWKPRRNGPYEAVKQAGDAIAKHFKLPAKSLFTGTP